MLFREMGGEGGIRGSRSQIGWNVQDQISASEHLLPSFVFHRMPNSCGSFLFSMSICLHIAIAIPAIALVYVTNRPHHIQLCYFYMTTKSMEDHGICSVQILKFA